jgi:hypothetical protein
VVPPPNDAARVHADRLQIDRLAPEATHRLDQQHMAIARRAVAQLADADPHVCVATTDPAHHEHLAVAPAPAGASVVAAGDPLRVPLRCRRVLCVPAEARAYRLLDRGEGRLVGLELPPASVRRGDHIGDACVRQAARTQLVEQLAGTLPRTRRTQDEARAVDFSIALRACGHGAIVWATRGKPARLGADSYRFSAAWISRGAWSGR